MGSETLQSGTPYRAPFYSATILRAPLRGVKYREPDFSAFYGSCTSNPDAVIDTGLILGY